MKTFIKYGCSQISKKSLVLILYLTSFQIYAATFTAKQTGNWSASSTWSSGSVPKAADNITIKSGITVTVDVTNAVCASLTLNDNVLGTASLLFNSNSLLVVSGTVTLSGNASGYNAVLNMTNGGTLECSTFAMGNGTIAFTPGTGTVQLDNNFTVTSSSFSTFNNLIIHGGTTTLNTDIILNGNLTIGTSTVGALTPQAHTVYIKGNWNHINPNNGFNEANSTICFNGTGNQTFNCTGSFNNVTVNKTSGNLTFEILNSGNAELYVANNLVITSGTLKLGSTARTVTIGGNLTVDGTLDLSSSNVTALTVAGNVASSGTIDVSGTSITNPGNRITTGGSFTMTGNGLLKVGRTNSFPTNYSTISLASTTTVNYSGTTQTVKGGITYGNVIISGSGTKTLAASTNIAGSITVSAGTFNVSTNATTITLNGTNTQTLTGMNFYNLTVNNTAPSNAIDLSTETTVSNGLVLTDGIINATTNALKLLAATTLSGTSNASHVKGSVKKITSSTTSFAFPIGDGINYRTIGIVNPSNDTWTASYAPNPYTNISSITKNNSIVINHVSSLEYWDLSPATNGSNAKIMISWNTPSYVKDPATTVIAHWSTANSYWENVGAVTIDLNGKTFTSINAWNTFSPFTLGSTVDDGSLPIELIEFKATPRKN